MIAGSDEEIDALERHVRLVQASAESKVLGILVKYELDFKNNNPTTRGDSCGSKKDNSFLQTRNKSEGDFEPELNHWETKSDVYKFSPREYYTGDSEQNSEILQETLNVGKEVHSIALNCADVQKRLLTTQNSIQNMKRSMSDALQALSDVGPHSNQILEQRAEKLRAEEMNQIFKFKLQLLKDSRRDNEVSNHC